MKNKAFPLLKSKILYVINKFIQKRSAEETNKNSVLDNLDFSEIIELNNNSELDPYFIKAIAIAVYENETSLSSFQFHLGVSWLRANVLLGQLLENDIVYKVDSDFPYDFYKTNISKKDFNEWYEQFLSENKTLISSDSIPENPTLPVQTTSPLVSIFDDISIVVTDDKNYNWLVEISQSDHNYSLDDKVYMMFCWLGSDKSDLKRCTTPEKFFDNLLSTITILKKLIKLEELKAYDFYEPFPSEQLKEIINEKNYINMVNDFIKRYWYRICQKASRYKTDKKRYEKINSFQSSLLQFDKYFLPENKNYIQKLAEVNIDIHNLPKPQKVIRPFDNNTEKILLRQLKYAQKAIDKHFCYNELIDFYFKYRNDYSKAVWECIKYCQDDINLLPHVESEYVNERISAIKRLHKNDIEDQQKLISDAIERGFRANLPAFDRITMLYYYEKDYETAISYCKLAIENDQDYDLKYTKRIDRFKKKRASEEKRAYGSPLLHLD